MPPTWTTLYLGPDAFALLASWASLVGVALAIASATASVYAAHAARSARQAAADTRDTLLRRRATEELLPRVSELIDRYDALATQLNRLDDPATFDALGQLARECRSVAEEARARRLTVAVETLYRSSSQVERDSGRAAGRVRIHDRQALRSALDRLRSELVTLKQEE